MNKRELVASIVAKTEEKQKVKTKTVEQIVDAFVEVVKDELCAGNKIQIVGFGTFEVSERESREGRNPKTGEPMTIPASKCPKFKASKGLKDALND